METEKDPEEKWQAAQAIMKRLFGKKPDLNMALFMIGIQELGQGPRTFSKEEKQDLMHIATCRLLSREGIFYLSGHDEDGWPHWERYEQLPKLKLGEQEKLLKINIYHYLRDELGLE